MTPAFEELDFQQTPMGDLMLRRRRIPTLDDRDVFEVKLGEEFLMSSLFPVAEIALADLALAELEGDALDIVVGGLGLGHTAAAALDHERVRSLLVIDTLAAVIGWHRRGIVPLGARIAGDARCRLHHGDFFALAGATDGFEAGRKYHAVLLDIDHTPELLLHARHAAFYEPEGLAAMARHLHPGGVFALWSDDQPDEGFVRTLEKVFVNVRAQIVPFHNPLLECEASNTVYLARKALEVPCV